MSRLGIHRMGSPVVSLPRVQSAWNHFLEAKSLRQRAADYLHRGLCFDSADLAQMAARRLGRAQGLLDSVDIYHARDASYEFSHKIDREDRRLQALVRATSKRCYRERITGFYPRQIGSR